jgi:hypothetical protein
MLTAQQLIATKSEREWAEYLVGRPFEVLNLVAEGGYLSPIAFTVVGYRVQGSTVRLHLHGREQNRVTVPIWQVVASVCNGDAVESSDSPEEWGRA